MAKQWAVGAMELQFGHGGEPWRTFAAVACRAYSSCFNSATAVNRGEPGISATTFGEECSFNSATAVNRGER